MVNGDSSNNGDVVFIGDEGFSVRPDLQKQFIEEQKKLPRFGPTQTGVSFPTVPLPPPQPEQPIDERLVSVSPEEALKAGVITQQQFEEATRPEILTATTKTGETFQIQSDIPITQQQEVVKISIPGQEPQVAPKGFVLTTTGGPRQVSFEVPEQILPIGKPTADIEVEKEEFQKSLTVGRFIPTDIERQPELQETVRFTGTIQVTPSGFVVTPVSTAEQEEIARQEEISKALTGAPLTSEIQQLREITLPTTTGLIDLGTTAISEISKPFPSQQISQEIGAGFVFAGLSLIPTVAIAITKPELVPSLLFESVRQLPKRVITEPLVVTGEIGLGVALGKLVGLGAKAVTARATPRITFEIGKGLPESKISIGTRPGKAFEFVTERLDVVTDTIGRRPLPRATGIRIGPKGEILAITETFAEPGVVSRAVSLQTIGAETRPVFSEIIPARITGVRPTGKDLTVGVEPGIAEQFAQAKGLPGGGVLRELTQTTPETGITIATSDLGSSIIFSRDIKQNLFTPGIIKTLTAGTEQRVRGMIISDSQLVRFVGERLGGPGEELFVTGGVGPRPVISTIPTTGVSGGISAQFGEVPTVSIFQTLTRQPILIEEIEIFTAPTKMPQALSPISISLLASFQPQTQQQKIAQAQTQRQLIGQRQAITQEQAQKQLSAQAQVQQQISQRSQLSAQLTEQTPLTAKGFAPIGVGITPIVIPTLIKSGVRENLLVSRFVRIPTRFDREPSLGGLVIGGFEPLPTIEAGLGIRKRTKLTEDIISTDDKDVENITKGRGQRRIGLI